SRPPLRSLARVPGRRASLPPTRRRQSLPQAPLTSFLSTAHSRNFTRNRISACYDSATPKAVKLRHANFFFRRQKTTHKERAGDRMHLSKRATAEFFGTFWLVFGGCGSAVLAAAFPNLGIGFAGVALAFGLTVLTMAFAIGPISGGHFNPAVTLGLWAGKRIPASYIIPYIVAQVLGAIVAAGVLYVIASGKPDFAVGGFASNGYGDLSPRPYRLLACLL